MSILVKNVLCNNAVVDVLIQGNSIAKIDKNIDFNADKIIDGTDKAICPGFVNCHTHSAMTFFRGIGDGLSLDSWLNDFIWPIEAKMTEETVYHYAKLAFLEMIKSGTTCFYDMYWFRDVLDRAATEIGIRAVEPQIVMTGNKPFKETVKEVEDAYKRFKPNDLTSFAVAPHAVYTVSKELLEWVRDFSEENNLLVQIHAAETKKENDDCFKQYGMTPIRFLESIGLLSPRLSVAHCLWVDNEEIKMLADNDVKVVHNPNSNLKLSSGYQFEFEKMKQMGITVGLGTDGCGSSDNLDMTEAMKVASLIGKAWRFDSKAVTANSVFDSATVNGGLIVDKKIGKIEEGYLADVVLFNLNSPAMIPNHNFIANVVYSANSADVDTVICNGKVLMENRYVDFEKDLIDEVKSYTNYFVKHVKL